MKKKIYLKTLTSEEIIKRLKDGEIVKRQLGDNELIFKMIDGIIVMEEAGQRTIGEAIYVDEIEDYYVEEEEKFEIKEIGVYKTRNGRKVFISKVEWYAFGVIEGTTEIHDWYVSGQYASCKQHEMDIVSKWEG